MLKASEEASKRLHAFDMASIAEATGSLVSAVLFGALAGSGGGPGALVCGRSPSGSGR